MLTTDDHDPRSLVNELELAVAMKGEKAITDFFTSAYPIEKESSYVNLKISPNKVVVYEYRIAIIYNEDYAMFEKTSDSNKVVLTALDWDVEIELIIEEAFSKLLSDWVSKNWKMLTR